jgi:hypothetical protein
MKASPTPNRNLSRNPSLHLYVVDLRKITIRMTMTSRGWKKPGSAGREPPRQPTQAGLSIQWLRSRGRGRATAGVGWSDQFDRRVLDAAVQCRQLVSVPVDQRGEIVLTRRKPSFEIGQTTTDRMP